VVRGSLQGESHGGLYLVDLEDKSARQVVDWSTPDIEWHGYGGDRGLRGIAFVGDTIYVAASDRLLALSPTFKLLDAWQNPYLKHCQEIAVWQRTLYLVSSGYDSILGFDLDQQVLNWALQVRSRHHQFGGTVFDPAGDDGPLLLEKLHLNSVHCNENGMYLSGLKTGGMLHFNGEAINMAVQLPAHTSNARPFRNGVLFNDNEDDVLRYTGRGDGNEDRAMAPPRPDTSSVEQLEAVDDGIVRLGFARGLCVLSNRLVAAGSSPSAITLYDLAENESLGSVRLSHDARTTIHSIAAWPYD
jgi:hypothetical protein